MISILISSVQLLSRVQLFVTPWTVPTRLPCPSPTPRTCSNSCPLSQWCHPTISSSVMPFSSCLRSFPAARSFQMSQFFALVGQSVGVSASASVLPMNIQDWFPLGWTGWISLQSHSCVQFFVTPWTAACQAYLSITNSQNLLKLLSIELVMTSNCLILCHPVLLLPSVFPSIRVFSKESVLHSGGQSISFSINSSNDYSE